MKTQNRRGLSILEFIGCFLALAGGVWLGAIYLGIDLHRATYVALSKSKLIDQVPEKWRPETPESEKAPSQAELAARVQDEVATLRQEINSLRSPGSEPVDTPAIEPATKSDPTDDKATTSVGQATLNYWKQLIQVVHNQRALQMEAEGAATEGNATKVATLKGRVNRLTATAIRALSTKNVDRTASDFAAELADWYEAGADLYDDAVQVWGTAAGQGNTQLAKEWQQAHVQFTNEGQLIRARAAAVRDTLNQQFGGEFPPLAGL